MADGPLTSSGREEAGRPADVDAAAPRARRLVDLVLHAPEGLRGLDTEARERVVAAQAHEVDALAQLGHEGQVSLQARSIWASVTSRLRAAHRVLSDRRDQRNVGRALPRQTSGSSSPGEAGLPARVHHLPLVLDGGGVTPEGPPDLEVLPLDDPLRPRDLARARRGSRSGAACLVGRAPAGMSRRMP